MATFCLLLIGLLTVPPIQSLNNYISDGDTYWNSTSDFMPSNNMSFGTIRIRSALYMQFDLQYHGKWSYSQWENVFRIGSAGFSNSDYRCSRNDRFPGLWIDDNTDELVFDISDRSNCFRQYTHYPIKQHSLYSIVIAFNSSWVHISINDTIITDEPRADITDPQKLNQIVPIYMSTVTSIPANVTLSNIHIRSFDDHSFDANYSYTLPPTLSPSRMPTLSPTQSTSRTPTKKPFTFFPTIETTTVIINGVADDSIPNFPQSTSDDNSSSTPSTTMSLGESSNITNLIGDDSNSDSSGSGSDGLSFELIFYILSGCAMGGIVCCVCTCCCFGWIVNKKIKTLSEDSDETQMGRIQYAGNTPGPPPRRRRHNGNSSRRMLSTSISNLFASKERSQHKPIPTVSGDVDDLLPLEERNMMKEALRRSISKRVRSRTDLKISTHLSPETGSRSKSKSNSNSNSNRSGTSMPSMGSHISSGISQSPSSQQTQSTLCSSLRSISTGSTTDSECNSNSADSGKKLKKVPREKIVDAHSGDTATDDRIDLELEPPSSRRTTTDDHTLDMSHLRHLQQERMCRVTQQRQRQRQNRMHSENVHHSHSDHAHSRLMNVKSVPIMEVTSPNTKIAVHRPLKMQPLNTTINHRSRPNTENPGPGLHVTDTQLSLQPSDTGESTNTLITEITEMTGITGITALTASSTITSATTETNEMLMTSMETEELLNHNNCNNRDRRAFVTPSPITTDTYERGVSFECGKENSSSFVSWTRTVSQTPLRPPAMYSNPTLQSELSGKSTNYSTVVQQPGSVNHVKSDEELERVLHEELKLQHVNTINTMETAATAVSTPSSSRSPSLSPSTPDQVDRKQQQELVESMKSSLKSKDYRIQIDYANSNLTVSDEMNSDLNSESEFDPNLNRNTITMDDVDGERTPLTMSINTGRDSMERRRSSNRSTNRNEVYYVNDPSERDLIHSIGLHDVNSNHSGNGIPSANNDLERKQMGDDMDDFSLNRINDGNHGMDDHTLSDRDHDHDDDDGHSIFSGPPTTDLKANSIESTTITYLNTPRHRDFVNSAGSGSSQSESGLAETERSNRSQRSDRTAHSKTRSQSSVITYSSCDSGSSSSSSSSSSSQTSCSSQSSDDETNQHRYHPHSLQEYGMQSQALLESDDCESLSGIGGNGFYAHY